MKVVKTDKKEKWKLHLKMINENPFSADNLIEIPLKKERYYLNELLIN